MTPRHRRISPASFRCVITAVVACLFVYGCGADSASVPLSGDDAVKAANVFTQLSDSIAKSGGDSSIARAYGSLADAVRMGFRVSRVTITVDGVPTPFIATAQVNVLTGPTCATCSGVSFPLRRTFIAWQANDPRRVVQVLSAASGDSFETVIGGVFSPVFNPAATLVFFDGKGGAYAGTSGTQHVTVFPSNVPCASSAISQASPAQPVCTDAEFSVDFSAIAEVTPFLVRNNAATGSHTLSMAVQNVVGVSTAMTTTLPPPPPLGPPSVTTLAATLDVKVDSMVTFTFTVTNPRNTAAAVTFSSGMHADFSAFESVTGPQVWRWSTGKLFTQIVSVDTLPPGGKLVYTQPWQPTRKGNFFASATLTSRSHIATAVAQFTVP